MSTRRGRRRRRRRSCPAAVRRNSSICIVGDRRGGLGGAEALDADAHLEDLDRLVHRDRPHARARGWAGARRGPRSRVRAARFAPSRGSRAKVSLRSASIRRWLGAYSPRTIAPRMTSVTRSSDASAPRPILDDRRHRVSFGSAGVPAASFNHYCQQYRRECLARGRSQCASRCSAWVKQEASTPPTCWRAARVVVGTDLHVTTVSTGVGLAADIPHAVRGADVVLSLVGAGSAAAVLDEALPAMDAAGIFVDMNTSGPDDKRRLAAARGRARHPVRRRGDPGTRSPRAHRHPAAAERPGVARLRPILRRARHSGDATWAPRRVPPRGSSCCAASS